MEKYKYIYSVILAAGESARMGFPKALLKLQNTTFLEHLINTIKSTDVLNIIVVLGCDAEKIVNSLNLEEIKQKINIRFLVNKDYRKGQLSSVQTAIQALPKDVDAIILFPVDRPLISKDVVEKLLKKYFESKAKIVIPTIEGKRGHPVLFSSSLLNELINAPLDVGARYVVWNHAEEVAEVPVLEPGILINIDTPEDYNKYILES